MSSDQNKRKHLQKRIILSIIFTLTTAYIFRKTCQSPIEGARAAKMYRTCKKKINTIWIKYGLAQCFNIVQAF